MMLHPEVAGRSCDECQTWMYDDGIGVMSPNRVTLATGEPMPRPRGTVPPCHQCPKVPREKRTGNTRPSDAIEPTATSWRAVRFHRRCKAVGRFPDDALVEANAAVIEAVAERIVADRAEEMAATLRLLAAAIR